MKRVNLPLSAGAALGPYILSGRENRRKRHQRSMRRETGWYQIVFVEDGSVPYVARDARHTPLSPFGLLVQPNTPVQIDLPMAVTWHLLMFDAVHQPVASA